MATHLPHGLQKLLEFTVGMPWPEGDEHEMWKLADSWRTFADELEQLASDLGVEAGAFGDAIQGEAGEQLQKYLRESLGGSADQMKDGAEQLAKALQNGGADIQKTKIMVIGMLAILAATLVSLFSSLFGSIFAPSVIAAARVGIGVLLRALVKKMMDAWEKDTPGRIENIARALGDVRPSQLGDPKLFDFLALGARGGGLADAHAWLAGEPHGAGDDET